MYQTDAERTSDREGGNKGERMLTTRATLTCPECGQVQEVDMPADACQFFCQCVGCGSVLRPKEGDCCVFCSYSDSLCQSRQLERAVKVLST